MFSFVAWKHNKRQLERKSESFFIIWKIPVHFKDVAKSLRTSTLSEHLPKVLQCSLGIATLMKMSNMLHIAVDHEGGSDFDQVEISQASEGALGQSTKNSFPVVLRPHVFTIRSSNL